MAHPDLTLLVPCYREGARVDALVAAWRAWQQGHAGVTSELLCVDDGSPDDTAARIEAHDDVRLVRAQANHGKGAALRLGVAQARGEVVLFLDADLAVDLGHVGPALDALRAGADVAIGSRALPGARTLRAQGPLRRTLGRLYRRLAVRWLELDVSDVTCGFKAFRGEAARTLFGASAAARWGIDAEILSLARRAGLRIDEFPVTWRDGSDSRVRILRDGVGALRELLATRQRRRGVPAGTPAARAS